MLPQAFMVGALCQSGAVQLGFVRKLRSGWLWWTGTLDGKLSFLTKPRILSSLGASSSRELSPRPPGNSLSCRGELGSGVQSRMVRACRILDWLVYFRPKDRDDKKPRPGNEWRGRNESWSQRAAIVGRKHPSLLPRRTNFTSQATTLSRLAPSRTIVEATS